MLSTTIGIVTSVPEGVRRGGLIMGIVKDLKKSQKYVKNAIGFSSIIHVLRTTNPKVYVSFFSGVKIAVFW